MKVIGGVSLSSVAVIGTHWNIFHLRIRFVLFARWHAPGDVCLYGYLSWLQSFFFAFSAGADDVCKAALQRVLKCRLKKCVGNLKLSRWTNH